MRKAAQARQRCIEREHDCHVAAPAVLHSPPQFLACASCCTQNVWAFDECWLLTSYIQRCQGRNLQSVTCIESSSSSSEFGWDTLCTTTPQTRVRKLGCRGGWHSCLELFLTTATLRCFYQQLPTQYQAAAHLLLLLHDSGSPHTRTRGVLPKRTYINKQARSLGRFLFQKVFAQ